MKKLIFKKQEAQPFVDFLNMVNLKSAKLTRLRTQLQMKLSEIYKQMEHDRLEIVKKYAIKDDRDELVIKKNEEGFEYYPTAKGKEKELFEEVKELREEEVAVEVGEYSTKLAPLFEHMDSDDFTLPDGFEGESSFLYNKLMEIWEEAQEKEEEEIC